MKKKKLNIIFGTDKAGLIPYDEVEDTIGDVIEAAMLVEDKLEDGFQPIDLFALLQTEKIAREVVNDAPVFWEQFQNLDGTEAQSAIKGVVQRVYKSGRTLGKISRQIVNFLYVNAKNYEFASDVFVSAQTQLAMNRQLYSGNFVLPEILKG